MIMLNPYLHFDGNAEAAFEFYRSAFGGEFQMIQRYSETPEADKVAEKDKDKIMHIALRIGDNILMATDAIEGMGDKLKVGNNFHLSIGVSSKKEADRLYKALSTGGQEDLPMSPSFWGSYFGMLTDRFGIRWMISFDEEQQSNIM
ncbi:VOC family protein [Candidatus Falkowbacteria bacterium HGW-Falkowbacteria-2]|uniref:VOC family protein n=1 Tax=Candidatus Falkowbacteria bacterium HGW-Falkowbacteria-2 TaxID=2013769 RepID=A0A2N2E155_9BACT|nr:MAG: VOC family protein [Candidatus Falkowbacteria bacterium HGW-Falkowbacteria-2]